MINLHNNYYNIDVVYDELKIVFNCYGHIYMIENKINGKKYIGQAVNFKRRLSEHFRDAKNNINYPLPKALIKYGLDNFNYSIIDIANDYLELNEKEIYYIDLYKSNNREFGYNIESGGNCSKATIETLLKMSESHLGIKQSDEWIYKRIYKAGSEEAKKYGKAKTEEEKKHLSENSAKFWLGKTRDEATREKIRQTKLEQGLTEKQKELFCKKVYKIDISTKETVNIFGSTKQASIFENVNQGTISRWCSNNKKVGDFIWSYKELMKNEIEEISYVEPIKTIIPKEILPRVVSDETRRKLSEARKGLKQNQEWVDKRIDAVAKPVIKLNKLTNSIIDKFRSLADAGRFNKDNLSYESISRLCLGMSNNDKDIIYCYEEDYLNNSIPQYVKKQNREFNELTQDEISVIYLKYKNEGISLRQLSDEYSINFSTLNKYIQNLEKPQLVFDKNKKYVVVCKKTKKRFVDFINKSGALTVHIKETYSDFVLESQFKRKQIELKTGKPWYYDYFEFIEI